MWGRAVSKRDRDYYLARISAEREAAERATSEAARAAHLELAEQYQERLEARDRGYLEPDEEEGQL
jgi:hypothetical protein